MKALSIDPYFAMGIMYGIKTVECRTWRTDYRGDILICSTRHKCHGTIPGHAICIAELLDVVPFNKKEHFENAMFTKGEEPANNLYAWLLGNIRLIKPIPLKGKLSLWEYAGDIEILGEATHSDEGSDIFDKYYKPLYI